MEISFNGFQENELTFECEAAVNVGDLVTMTASGKVGKAAADGNFIGVCVKKDSDGYAAVQVSGYAEYKKSGTVNVGYNKLVAATNSVKTGSAGIDRLVVFVDDTSIGFIL